MGEFAKLFKKIKEKKIKESGFDMLADIDESIEYALRYFRPHKGEAKIDDVIKALEECRRILISVDWYV
ncbi:MAG: hypothetical protein ACE5FT_05580 [Candidatus Nanoarchaeia archaeon]